MGDSSLESRIASLVHSHFDALPKRSKPIIHTNGSREWIPLSGIVLVTGENTPEESLTCVAIATGAKCLSSSQIPQCQGMVLHDSHAEILAIRAFNHWLLEECKSMLDQGPKFQIHNEAQISITQITPEPSEKHVSRYVTWRSHSYPPFTLNPNIKIYMYGTCAPCGDSSMELCMASQEDPTPWTITPPPTSHPELPQTPASTAPPSTLLNGRAHFSILGAVRRKPSRADAESTLSKSCSDKLAVKQVTSLLTFPTCLLVAPSENAYLAALLLPEEEISDAGCKRAFGGSEEGRMRGLNGRSWGGVLESDGYGPRYAFRPFEVRAVSTAQVEREWMFGKPRDCRVKSKPGNVSAVWTAGSSLDMAITKDKGGLENLSFTGTDGQSTTNLCETLINGVKQGYRISSPMPKKASALSRAKMWGLLRDIVRLFLAGINSSGLGGHDVEAVHIQDHFGANDSHFQEGSLLLKMVECVTTAKTYEEMKQKCADAGLVKAREDVLFDVRMLLGNWVENRGDEDWGLEVLNEVRAKKVVGV
ncbi:hypothetical protein FQN52_006406 [Onygenales sp. PD_12]|nr:hypothetical protein FQN52_006406 [Onygenales sp. PD_12]